MVSETICGIGDTPDLWPRLRSLCQVSRQDWQKGVAAYVCLFTLAARSKERLEECGRLFLLQTFDV